MHFGILAAGEGSRLVQEGVALPKPLVLIEGKPMIGRLIDMMVANDAESISIIVNEQMAEVADFVRSYRDEHALPIHLVVESTPSSMHSFCRLSTVVEGDKFILTTVDTIFRPNDFRAYVDAFNAAHCDALMAVTSYIDDEKPLYVETDAEMRVTAFSDKPSAEGARFVSGGIYGMTPASFKVVRWCVESGMSRMRNFQRQLLVDGLDVRAWDFGKILDVDHAEDIKKANQFLENE